IGGLALALITMFAPKAAPFTSPLYALAEGLFLGALSAFVEMRFPGIAFQAVGLTFCTLFAMLALYTTGVIRATPAFKRGIMAATFGIMMIYLLSWILRMFSVEVPYIHGSGLVGIGFSLFVVVIAAMNLVLDFDLIEEGAKRGLPKYMEWFAAFGLLVTLVWLYIEILHLLSKIRQR
ncbi:MAG: Bax inhibitor-1/YccA family protein, partial [Planctomycetes bacterium]|nr:Bax inhibitor-1/YccA family protein [Planctomycetota bacterium]